LENGLNAVIIWVLVSRKLAMKQGLVAVAWGDSHLAKPRSANLARLGIKVSC
jgi:hypothetical protein